MVEGKHSSNLQPSFQPLTFNLQPSTFNLLTFNLPSNLQPLHQTVGNTPCRSRLTHSLKTVFRN
jgi:hypothetical protein